MSDSVSASTSPLCVKRSEQKSTRWVSSNSTPASQPCFALEPCQAIGGGGEVRGQGFDRNRAVKLGIAGKIDPAHPATPELRLHLV